jgi:hypothetical protein
MPCFSLIKYKKQIMSYKNQQNISRRRSVVPACRARRYANGEVRGLRCGAARMSIHVLPAGYLLAAACCWLGGSEPKALKERGGETQPGPPPLPCIKAKNPSHNRKVHHFLSPIIQSCIEIRAGKLIYWLLADRPTHMCCSTNLEAPTTAW